MLIRGIELHSVEWDDPYGGNNKIHRSVVFTVQTQDDTLSLRVWLEGDIDETKIVQEARAKLHALLQALADRTRAWAAT